MYKKGEYIIYGTKGVCEVKDVAMTSPFEGCEKRLYYILVPLSTPNSTVYAPAENGTVFTRHLISPQEAQALLDEVPDLEDVTILREKDREPAYKNCIRSFDCRECAKLIKTLHNRKLMRLSIGKKVTATDDRYMKLAEDTLYSELALQLKMDKKDLAAEFQKILEQAC